MISPGHGLRVSRFARANGSTFSPFGWASGSQLHSVAEADRHDEMDSMAAAGAEWCRFDLDWWSIEGTEGVRDWSRWDTYLTELKARGIRPLLVVLGTPPWARSGGDAHTPPTDNADYGDFAAAAVARYANPTYNAYHYELWNEPNISAFWNVTGGPKAGGPAKYVGMVQDAYTKMKAANSDVTVIAGVVSQAGDSSTDYDPRDYYTQIYAEGVKDYCDALSTHCYHEGFPTTRRYDWDILSQIFWDQGEATFDSSTMSRPSLRETMALNGDEAKALWLTEVGMLADGSEPVTGFAKTQARAAAFLSEIYEMWRTFSWSRGVACWYNYQGHGDFSLEDPATGLKRAAYTAYNDAPKYRLPG